MVYEEMLAKHPQKEPPQLPLTPTPSPVELSDNDLVKTIRSFPSGTAPGPSGLRANHLKEAMFCLPPDHATSTLQARPL